MNDFFHQFINHFTKSDVVLVFGTVLAIILIVPLVLKRYNIPGIVGLIIAGMVIGPYGLDFIENNAAVTLFSTIGLLYIMFVAGLELDLNRFGLFRNKSIIFGCYTFIIPLVIGYPVCHYLLGYDVGASLLIASMFSTHTLIAYPIVSRLGIANNVAVSVTVGGTILTDTAVLILFSIIIAKHNGNMSDWFWLQFVLSLVIFTLIMFWTVPRLAKWFFEKFNSEEHAHYIFVLSIVFMASFLAELAGVDKIIGAFVAGLILNRLIPHSSPLMRKIEFMGNALFIPIFLISVGMLVNIHILFEGPTALIVAATLTIVALLGKWLAATVTQLSFRFSTYQRNLIFGLSSSHAAATLVIITVGYQVGILDKNVLNGTILLILVTCLVASYVTEKTAKAIVVSDGAKHLDNKEMDEHILAPVSSQTSIEKLLEFTRAIKNSHSPNPISLLAIVPYTQDASQNIISIRNRLAHYQKQTSLSETPINVLTSIEHNKVSGIRRVARETLSNIIVIDRIYQRSMPEKTLSRRLESIARYLDKTVLMTNLRQALSEHDRIVLIVPPHSENDISFELWADKIAQLAMHSKLPLLHYCSDKTQQALARIYKRNGITQNVEYLPFTLDQNLMSISEQVKDADLIILVGARRGSIAYTGTLEKLPITLERYFNKNSQIIILPERHSEFSLYQGQYSHLNAE